ncbi:glycosyltransferase [Halomonas organivorans]|uniref:Glycosyltransferase involved in cell wall biosynthesis n=1 Tax=Halomonas organivorans TaxID=257772 RepID=A0A7W5C365_9GAMM|nr:glycosyltransferase [Halomonas organivorans]MBB3143483.1 glycosyltransferase involved in cell wall biosynthesis [Halomonas organivorans]
MNQVPAKRFAFVIEDLYGGGAQKSLLYTADQLRQRGHAVKVFTLRERVEHRLPEGLEIENLAVVTRLTKATSTVLTEKWQASRIKRALAPWQPDVVISCSCDKITRHLDFPNLYFWVKSDVSAKFSDPQQRERAFAKVRRFYRGRQVIAVSKGVKDNLERVVGLEAERIVPIYNPYEREPFVAMAEEDAPVPDGDFFLCVAAIEPRKRHDRLLRAYAESGVTTPLAIMGKGKPEHEASVREQIEALGLEDRVLWLGYHHNPYPFIRQAKAMVLTSDAEGLPRVLIEALLLQTPVVSVDCPSGPREILTQELAEYLVAPDDEPGLADALRRMDRSPVAIEPRHYRQFLKETVLPQFEAL